MSHKYNIYVRCEIVRGKIVEKNSSWRRVKTQRFSSFKLSVCCEQPTGA